jgi:chaperonin GroES
MNLQPIEDRIVYPLAIKVGDKVALGKYGGTPVEIDGEELHVIREEDVLAIVG